MRFSSILIGLVLLFSLFAISGCKEKPECESSSDCITGNPCILGKCRDGKCINSIQDDCCGNGKCEESAGENKCLCPKDCGKCEGRVKYNVSSYRGPVEKDAEYAKYFCQQNQCVIGISESDVNVLRLANEIDVRNAFKAEVLSTLNNPFDISRGKMNIRVTLKDIDSAVLGSIKFTSIQVLSGSELMGEKILANQLNIIGSSFTEELALTSAQSAIEEEKRIDVKIDYEYVYTYMNQEYTQRDDAKNRLSTQVMFVAP